MAVGNVKTTCLSAGAVALMLMAAPAVAQPECESANKDCLDYCHYAPQHQWTSGFKCKRQCRQQLDQCRRGMRGYPPRYDSRGYGSSYGRGYGAPAPYSAGAPVGQAPAQSTYAPQAGQAAPATRTTAAAYPSGAYVPQRGYYPGAAYSAPRYGLPSAGRSESTYPPPP